MNQSEFTDLVSYMYQVLEHIEVLNEYNVAVARLIPKQLILAIPRLFNGNDKVAQVVWPTNGFVPFTNNSGVQLLRAYGPESEVYFSGESQHRTCAQNSNFTKFSKHRIEVSQKPISYNANATGNRMYGKTPCYPMWKKVNDTKSSLASKHVSYYSNLVQVQPTSFQQDGQSQGGGSNNLKSQQSMRASQRYVTVTDGVPLLDPSSAGSMSCDHFFTTKRHARFSESDWQRMLLLRHQTNSRQNGKIMDTSGSSKASGVMTDEQIPKKVECDRVCNGHSIYQNSQRIRNSEKNKKEDKSEHAAHKRVITRLQLAKACPARKEWRYEKDRWTTVAALCYSLEKMCKMNDNARSADLEDKTEFHAETVPSISLAAYLERIAWYFDCSTQCFVLALEYINRLEKHKRTLKVNKNSVHQLVATCVKIAAKYFDDKVFKNSFYAQVAGLSPVVINAFEVRVLFFLKFDLYIEPEQYQKRYKMMLSRNVGPNAVIISPAGNCHTEGEVRSWA